MDHGAGDDLNFDDVFADDSGSAEVSPSKPSNGRHLSASSSSREDQNRSSNGSRTSNRDGQGRRAPPQPNVITSSNIAIQHSTSKESTTGEPTPVDDSDSKEFARSLPTEAPISAAGGMPQRGSTQHRLSPDNFELICKLGEGAYGKVVQTKHKVTKQVRSNSAWSLATCPFVSTACQGTAFFIWMCSVACCVSCRFTH